MTDTASLRERHDAATRMPADIQGIDFSGLRPIARRYRRVLLALPSLLVVAAVLWTLLTPRTYTSTASFLPKGSSGGATPGSDIAARFGISLGTSDPASSPAFYARLLESRAVLSEAAAASYDYLAEGRRRHGTLDHILEITEPDSARRRALLVEKLKSQIEVKTDATTGVVEVSVEARDPLLAQTMTVKLLELVNEFNLRTRQSQAGLERKFVQERLAQVRGELQAATSRLQAFLQQNMVYQSPQLMLTREQLTQDVSARQQLVTSLSQAYENARISEVRDTPVITVLEPADIPVRPNSRGTILKVLLAAILGVLLAIGWVLWKEYLHHPAEQPHG